MPKTKDALQLLTDGTEIVEGNKYIADVIFNFRTSIVSFGIYEGEMHSGLGVVVGKAGTSLVMPLEEFESKYPEVIRVFHKVDFTKPKLKDAPKKEQKGTIHRVNKK